MKKQGQLIGCTIVGGIGLLITGVLGVVLFLQYSRYQEVAERLPDSGAPILVAITDPINGVEKSAGTPVLVHVEANAEASLVSLELWANGVLIGIQSAPSSDGIVPLIADFAWTPAEPGSYSLVARATNVDGQIGSSAAVWVSILPTTKPGPPDASEDPTGEILTTNDGGGGEGASEPPVLEPLPPPPAAPGPDESIAPGDPWEPSVVEWVSQVTISEMPETPQLTLTTEACNVTLNIHDLSNTEDGFFVYRRLEGEPNWVRIATLNNASNSDWLTYTDSGHPGPITYYAAAFNSQGEAASNLAPAQVDPAACPAISPALPQLSIELVDLIVDGPADQVYCYKSLGGVLWSRWPAGGFFLPGPEGFDVQGQGESLLLEGLEGDSLSLDLECWGWVGGSLQLLGKFHEDDIANPTRLGDLRLQNDRLRLDLALGGGIKPLDKHQPEPPMDTTMPRIFAIKLFGADACVGHTPNAIMAVLICTWYPEYEQSNQPYLVWDTNDNSCADPGGGCAPLSWYVDRADLYGGYVAFRVRTITNEQNLDFVSSNFPVAATPHDVTAWAIAPQQSQCGKLMGLYVQIFFQSGANDPDYGGQAFVSPPSNTVYHPIYCSPPNEVKLDVVFDSLNLSQVDDGWNADLELYASLVAEGIPGTGSVLNLGYWGWQGDDCDDDTVGFILDPGGLDLDPECTLQLGSGDHPFSDMYLCSSDTYAHCIGNYSQNNNRIQITVGNGSKVRISVHIMDFDDGSGDDTVCQTQTFIGPKSNAEWAGFTTNGELDDVQSSAGCEVSFHVSPAP